MQKVQKVFSIISNIIFYPILALIVAGLILVLCGVKPYITMSGSMEPVIHTGSLCFVDTKANYEEIEVGDVIAYKAPTGGLVTHRVISISNEGMETMGDANDVSDGISTNANNFHGKTLFSVPYAGYIVKYLQQPAIMAIVIVVIIGSFALNMVDAKEEKKKENEELETASGDAPAHEVNT